MFGLEGSGFTISIGVTLLLVGLVVFYVKQRMDEWDNKLQGMLNLNKALAASHAALEQRVMAGTYSNNNAPVTENPVSASPFDGSGVNNVADNRQVVSDDSSSESESDTDSDSDSVDENEETKHMVIGSELNNNNESNNDGIKVVELESGGDNKQINLNEESLEEISLNTSTNDDVEQELEGGEDEDDDDEDDDDEDDDDETEATELSTEDISNNVAELLNVKKVATEVTAELDFKKLNVGKLRELVVTRSLADKAGAKKMKKKELVELLS